MYYLWCNFFKQFNISTFYLGNESIKMDNHKRNDNNIWHCGLQQRDFVLLIIYDMYAKIAGALPIAQNYLTRKENVHVKH